MLARLDAHLKGFIEEIVSIHYSPNRARNIPLSAAAFAKKCVALGCIHDMRNPPLPSVYVHSRYLQHSTGAG
jgi:hypothetical protein